MTWFDPEQEDTTTYKVVLNHEEQYSIWPDTRVNPPGWRDGGKSGNKAECLEHINTVWTDMRPLSLRTKMEEDERRRQEHPEEFEELIEEEPEEESLVDRLCRGDHPVEVSLRPDRTVQAFKERLDMGYVHVKFTGTRGGTELGVRLDPDRLELGTADFGKGSGRLRLVGGLTLDYVKVRCIADIDLSSLEGTGRLERDEA